MTVTKVVSVHCDNCGQWLSQENSSREALVFAREKGWTRVKADPDVTKRGYLDLCPICSQAGKEEEAKK